MKHTRLSILGFALCLTIGIHAQTTTANEEELALPEGMKTQEIDSLLRDWYARNYLTFDEQCETTNENHTFEEKEYIQ